MSPTKPKTSRRSLIGLTGGLAAGKSTVAEIIRSQNYTVLNADELAREITAPGSSALAEISAVFGPNALTDKKELNRKFIRERITNYPQERKKLDAITHPRIQDLRQSRSDALFAQGEKIVFYEAPLLFEAKLQNEMAAVICVVANDSERISRTEARDNVSKKEATGLLSTQMPQEEKAKLADYVIVNNGDLKELKNATLALLEQIKAKF